MLRVCVRDCHSLLLIFSTCFISFFSFCNIDDARASCLRVPLLYHAIDAHNRKTMSESFLLAVQSDDVHSASWNCFGVRQFYIFRRLLFIDIVFKCQRNIPAIKYIYVRSDMSKENFGDNYIWQPVSQCDTSSSPLAL